MKNIVEDKTNFRHKKRNKKNNFSWGGPVVAVTGACSLSPFFLFLPFVFL